MIENYFPVPLKRIVVDSVPNFDLYMKQKERYVLYRNANIKFEKSNLDNLMGNNIVSLYVSKKDIKQYEEYRQKMRAGQEEEAKKQGYTGIFVDPEEIERYHDIRANFHLIECKIFEPGLEIDFPVYYHKDNDVQLCADFESKPEGPWVLTDKFLKVNGLPLMIRNEDIEKYRAYLANLLASFSKVWRDDSVRVQREAIALREMSKMVVKDVLDDPRSGEKIKQVNVSVHSLIGFILDNEASFYSLMRISSHDYYTYVHSINVCTFCVGLGSALGLPEYPHIEMLGLGAMLHDVGKSQIDSQLINKPGKLTDEEFKRMKDHVAQGVDILKKHHNLPEQALEPVAQHHEKITGTGYPNGLKGDQIGLFGRISSIADIYDALTTERSYKRALTPFEALSFLNKTSADYDRQCLTQFIMTLGKQIRDAK
ncbi:MAG TPA: HD-GYP domain-containing protein [archaeon]|nr:HD-GYP domain-containing protein [archaeon]